MKSGGVKVSLRTARAVRYEVVFIGYGNTLRSDDGIGPVIVSHLAAAFQGRDRCLCMSVPQLTPELVEDLKEASRVVFVDASVAIRAGRIQVRRLRPAYALPVAHDGSPQYLLSLCQTIYDIAPIAWSVAIGVLNLGAGERFTPPVCRASARVFDLLRHRANRWCPQN